MVRVRALSSQPLCTGPVPLPHEECGVPLTIPELALVLFEYLNVLVAFCAVVLAVQWKKTEFFAGLFFLLLYTIIDAIEISLSAIFDVSMINASQFGFILLAIIGLILGMRPATGIWRSPGK